MNSEVLHDCFRRLVPHLDTARIALTGGVAIGLRARGVAAAGLTFLRHHLFARHRCGMPPMRSPPVRGSSSGAEESNFFDILGYV
jgi:hypothetical protein